MNVAVISHALVEPSARKRWEELAARHRDVCVTLLVPRRWDNRAFGSKITWHCDPVSRERFRVVPLPIVRGRGSYVFRSLDLGLRRIHPDAIVVFAWDMSWTTLQAAIARSICARQAKLLLFSWENMEKPLKRIDQRIRWSFVRSALNGAIAGNSDAARLLRQRGVEGPIEIATEIGVDPERFRRDQSARREVRAALGLDGFVIGFAGRIIEAKGIFDLIRAVKRIGACTLLFVGDGPDRSRLEAEVAGCSPDVRTVIIGRVPHAEVGRVMCAMDCLVLPSRTGPEWKEQFGLVLAQAMMVGVPVVGSDSGAIPEVIGDAGIIFPEGDTERLGAALSRLIREPELCQHLSQMGRERAIRKFSTTALAESVYHLLSRVLDSEEQR